METVIVGIDVAKEKLDVCVCCGGREMFGQFENTVAGHQKLMGWVGKQRGTHQVHVCLEATGQYGDGVAEYLYQQGLRVSVVNPARIKHYGRSQLRRNKTDKADAALIADFCASQQPDPWSPPPAEFKTLQALVRRLEDLMAARLQESNRLHSGVSVQVVVEDLQNHLAYLDQQIQNIKRLIQEHIDQHPRLCAQQALLVSIPGIGKLTAAKLLGEIRSIDEFEDARQLAAYAGLTPEIAVSGSSVRKKPHLSKTGNANLRKALFMPAISAKRYNPIIAAFCSRLSLAGLLPMQVIGAAMRKLLHIVYGVLKHGRPFDPAYLSKCLIYP
jgi:transposase